MRTHGWAGDPPVTDEEAQRRILTAAVTCIDELGADADVAKIAARIGVTRQTVYRYFPSRRALFEAVAIRGMGSLVERIVDHLGDVTDTSEAIVETMLFCVRTLPSDPRLAFVAQPGRADALIMRSDAPQLAIAVLHQLPIDLTGLDEKTLAEHMVRLIQSLLLDEATAERSEDDLRQFLHACLDHHLTR